MPRVSFDVAGARVSALHLPAPSASAGGLVVVHGMASCIREFRDTLPMLQRATGLHVLAVDLRGHGESGGEPRGHTSREMAAEDLFAAAKYMREAAGVAGRLALLGHSLGASLAIGALARDRDGVFSCGVAGAPPDRLTYEINALEHASYRIGGAAQALVGALTKKTLYAPYAVKHDELYDDPEAVEWARKEAFMRTRIPLSVIDPMLRVHTSAWARDVRVPMLVIIPTHDRVVKPANARNVFDALAGEKELFEHPAGHSIFGDAGREKVVERVAGFLGKRIG